MFLGIYFIPTKPAEGIRPNMPIGDNAVEHYPGFNVLLEGKDETRKCDSHGSGPRPALKDGITASTNESQYVNRRQSPRLSIGTNDHKYAQPRVFLVVGAQSHGKLRGRIEHAIHKPKFACRDPIGGRRPASPSSGSTLE